MDDSRRLHSILIAGIGWVVSLLALGFVIRWITGLGNEVWSMIGRLDWLLVALSLALFMPHFAFRAAAWELITVTAGFKGPRWAIWRMWAISELARYIPGNVWSFAIRYKVAHRGGVDRKRSLASLIVDACVLVGSAGIVATMTLPVGWYMAVTACVAVASIMGLTLGPCLMRYFWPTQDPGTVPPLGRLYLYYVAAWVFYGAGAATLWWAFPEHELMTWSLAFGSNVAAWMVGYLSIVTPMGLGVREVAFVALVPPGLDVSLAGLVALITRLMMMLTEFLFVGCTIVISRRHRLIR